MNNKHNKNENSNLSIIEAVETLSSIADLDIEGEVGITQTHDVVVGGEKISYRTVHWLRDQDADATIEVVRDTFRTVLDYLKNFYKKEYGTITNPKTIEGIKTIMVLVGEAAKKLDKYTSFFREKNLRSATELKEYKQLQEFYHKKINQKIDEGMLGRWILALTQRATMMERPIKVTDRKLKQTKHIFVDLEGVRKDTEYELFFLRKEDGTRFFSPRLIRNIKLVCDFGDYFGEQQYDDPLGEIKTWQDKYAQASAFDLREIIHNDLEEFYRSTTRLRDNELVSDLKMALMALLMSANTSNLECHKPVKSCADYFGDFQMFLRRAMNSRDYQKLVAYPPNKGSKVGYITVMLIRKLCEGIFTHLQGLQRLLPTIAGILLKAHNLLPKNSQTNALEVLSNKLLYDYKAMNQLLKLHPNGPLIKVLDFLQEAGHKEFDALTQENIPNRWFDLYAGERKMAHERIASPTRQEFIHKSSIADEFKEFLREYSRTSKKHLVINLQDRTSWREHSRCQSIEELQKHKDFSDSLTTVTLAIDTDFYYQLPPYHNENHAEIFFEQLADHIEDESAGCHFPQKVREHLFSGAIDSIIDAIHQVFFNGKNVLLREHRLDFIQLFYLFLELKILDIIKPDSFSFCCKDAIDTGSAATALVYTFMKLIKEEHLTDAESDYLNLILYGPPVIIRERNMLPERFNRFVNAVKAIEHARHDVGHAEFSKLIHKHFGKIFKTPILDARVVTPKIQNVA